MNIQTVYQKLFLSSYFFTIAIRKKKALWQPNETFQAESLMHSTRNRWYADPILAESEGKTYLFYEALVKGKGRIECVSVSDDGSLGKPKVILEDNCHYSYPFVFSRNGQWYMIPESSAAAEVRLYRAISFPYEWKQEGVLLRQKSVDTTVFSYEEQWYLQTFQLCPGSERVTPQIYRMDWKGNQMPVLHEMIWEHYDQLLCRGAGPCFWKDGQLIRPAQENGENRYGDAVRFHAVEIDGDVYREKKLYCLSPEHVKADIWLDGLHTYAASEQFEAIDIRVRKFDLWKVPRILLNKCGRMLKR